MGQSRGEQRGGLSRPLKGLEEEPWKRAGWAGLAAEQFAQPKSPSYSNWLVASLVAQMVRVCLQRRRPRAGSRGHEDSLEKGMATHSSILAWRIPWTEGGKSQT